LVRGWCEARVQQGMTVTVGVDERRPASQHIATTRRAPVRSKGAAVMCDRSLLAIAIGIERLLFEEGARIGRTGRVVCGQNLSWDRVARSWRERVEGLMRAGTSRP
jgi:hypothetical protein